MKTQINFENKLKIYKSYKSQIALRAPLKTYEKRYNRLKIS